MAKKQSSRRTFLKHFSFSLVGAGALAEILPIKQAFARQLAELSESANNSFASMRSVYSLAPHITYFNHGSIGTIPKIVQQAHKSYLDLCESNPHKWVQSPKGTGLLYVRRAVQEKLQPMWVTWGQQRWKDSARRFEDYGTRNLAAVLALGDAMDFHRQLGGEAKEERLKSLWQYFSQTAQASDAIIWRSPKSWELSCSLYTIEVKNKDSRALLDKLYKIHGVIFRAFHSQDWNTLRISPNFYNTGEEMDRFFGLLS